MEITLKYMRTINAVKCTQNYTETFLTASVRSVALIYERKLN